MIVGVTPERDGIGGVSIHVQRLLDYMNAKGVPFSFMDYRHDGLLGILRAVSRSKVVHLHISNPILQLFWTAASRLLGTKTVLTLHGNYGRYGKLKNFMVRCSLRLATVPIVINQKSYDSCKRLNKNIRQVCAFIPPQKEERLDNKARQLLSAIHEQGRTIVSTNASNVAVDRDGRDMYGIDFLIDYFKGNPKCALLISDPSGNYHKKYPETTGSVFFIDYPHSYFEVLKQADCFVRNTPTDGDALSVREALYLGKPALCSDAVDRPEGVRLFKYSDPTSFAASMNDMTPPSAKQANGAEEIVEVYNRLM